MLNIKERLAEMKSRRIEGSMVQNIVACMYTPYMILYNLLRQFLRPMGSNKLVKQVLENGLIYTQFLTKRNICKMSNLSQV
jgi:hypothetical protein